MRLPQIPPGEVMPKPLKTSDVNGHVGVIVMPDGSADPGHPSPGDPPRTGNSVNSSATRAGVSGSHRPYDD